MLNCISYNPVTGTVKIPSNKVPELVGGLKELRANGLTNVVTLGINIGLSMDQ